MARMQTAAFNALRPPLGVVTVIVIAVLFGLGGAIILLNFDAVVGDIRATLAYVPPPKPDEPRGVESGTLVLMIDHEPPSDTVRGFQIAILTMLLGGLPAASLALSLDRRSNTQRTRWTASWSQVFLAGFVFQLGSLFYASVFMLMLMVASDGGRHLVGDLYSIILTAVMALTIVCSVAGLRAWHRLRASVAQEPLTLA